MFGMEKWKRLGSGGDPGTDEKARMAAIAKITEAKGHLRTLTTLEIFEAAGCAIGSRGTFNAWCEAHDTFEFFTSDFVAALASHLRRTLPNGGMVLELGAGNGRLSYFLRRKLKGSEVTVVATDKGTWGLKRKDQLGAASAVKKMDFAKALEQHRPDVVLVSWMPMGTDWSAAIRATPSVSEYVLVGEADDGCCGDNWLTWGNPHFAPGATRTSPAAAGTTAPPQPPYALEGWTRHALPEVDKFQLSRYDSEDFVGNSCSVAFRRTR